MEFKFIISPELYRTTLSAFALIFLNEYLPHGHFTLVVQTRGCWLEPVYFFSLIEFSGTKVIKSVIYVLT